MPRPTNQLELIEDFGIPRLSGPNGQKFIGCVFAAINDMLVEGAATAVRAALLYDVNPRTPDESGEQPLTAIELLGQEAMLPLYPGETHASLVTQLRRKWDHYEGGIKDALLSELERAGYEAIIGVPNDLDLTPTFITTRTSAGTGTFTALWPTSVDRGQLGLLIVETANEAIGLEVIGWRALAAVGIGSAGGVSATRLTLFAKVAEANDEPGAVVTVSGVDHAIAAIATFAGADLDLDVAIHDVAIATSADADETSISIAAPASEVRQTLQVLITTNQIDGGGGNNVSAQANAALTDITEHLDTNSGAGNGGGITITSGKLADIGSAGIWTATQTASRWAAVNVAIAPRQYWSRFWVGVTNSPITGPGLSWGAHRVGQDQLGPADMPVGYLETLRSILARGKPSQWINWEVDLLLDTGTVRILNPLVDDPTHVYFS